MIAQAFKIVSGSWLTVVMKQQLEVYLSSLRDDLLISRITRKRLAQLDQVECTVLPQGWAEEVEHWLAGRDVTVRPGERGTSVVAGTVSTAGGARLTQRLTQVAGWLAETGDTRTKHVLRSVVLGMLADPGTVDNLYARVCAHRAGQDLLDFDPLAAPPSGGPLPATVLYVHHEPDSRCWSLDGGRRPRPPATCRAGATTGSRPSPTGELRPSPPASGSGPAPPASTTSSPQAPPHRCGNGSVLPGPVALTPESSCCGDARRQ